MVEEVSTIESKAPFNMALNTLERLGYILSEIRRVSSEPLFDKALKQSMKVQLTKQFFIQASPLLPEEVALKYSSEIISLRPNEQAIVKKTGMEVRATNEIRKVFDWALEDLLDSLLIKIQRELQKEKYFMPPKRDKGRAVAEF